MKYIILDLEATCWQTGRYQSEIIEIGALSVDEDKNITGEFAEFVRPIINPQLSDFCTELTSITQEDVDQAKGFPLVIKAFQDWIGLEQPYLLCSWGHYDKKQFKLDCETWDIETDWLEPHISLKHQHFDLGISGENLKRPIGMKTALKIAGEELEGTHHRGIDDARNITKIFLKYFDKWEK